jgi:GntR family transcriptional regulator
MVADLKHERIARVLGQEIRTGAIRRGGQLPGEVALAKRFSVSRSTVRTALAELTAEGLITTRTGKGSYVLFDGRPLDDRLGWAQAFAAQGVAAEARIVKIAEERSPALQARVRTRHDSYVVVERIRDLASGEVLSWERSWIPATGGLRDLPGSGLKSVSLTQALAAEGLFTDHGTQTVSGRLLTEPETELLQQEQGTWFLRMEQTHWSDTDEFVEHVESLLNPKHFELSLTFNSREA